MDNKLSKTKDVKVKNQTASLLKDLKDVSPSNTFPMIEVLVKYIEELETKVNKLK